MRRRGVAYPAWISERSIDVEEADCVTDWALVQRWVYSCHAEGMREELVEDLKEGNGNRSLDMEESRAKAV